MGFTESRSIAALEYAHNDFQVALDALVTN